MSDTSVTTTIHLDGAVNARDLEGVPLADGATVAPGVLLRSDNLQDLSERDIAHLVDDHGLHVVVDLRTGYELRSEGPGPLNHDGRVRIEHHSLYPETGGGTDLDLPPIKPWGDGQGAEVPGESPTVRAYLGYLHRRPDSVAGALRAVATADGAALVHCAAGKDRTGVVVALALAVAGADVETIAADYLATGANIDAIVARLTATQTYRAEMAGSVSDHAPIPGTMERFFAVLERDHGGVAAWLQDAGFGDREQQALRARLRGETD